MTLIAPETERPPVTFEPTAKQAEANRLIFGGAPHILLYGGSRSGKTFIEVRALVTRALRAPGLRQAVWRQHFNHAKASVGMDTFPKVMRLCYPDLAYLEFSNEGIVTFPNSSELWLAGLDDKDRVEKILGQEFGGNLFNEISTMSFHAVETGLSRAAQRVMVTLDGDLQPLPKDKHFECPIINMYDMNPVGRRHWSYQLFIKKEKPGTTEPVARPEDYVHLQMNPEDNRENLPAQYFDTLQGFTARKRRRFLEGKFAQDIEGALWKEEALEAAHDGGSFNLGAFNCRDDFEAAVETLDRVIVGVDPSGASSETSEGPVANDIGIVVCGKGRSGTGYVLEDASINAGPAEWGAAVVKAFDRWKGDRVVAERNFGGEMVRFVLLSARSTLPVTITTSSRGKAIRAEPVAGLYEPGHRKVKHAGYFAELEDQMASMLPHPVGFTGEGSPDRLDAAVFALNELMLGGTYNLNNLD